MCTKHERQDISRPRWTENRDVQSTPKNKEWGEDTNKLSEKRSGRKQENEWMEDIKDKNDKEGATPNSEGFRAHGTYKLPLMKNEIEEHLRENDAVIEAQAGFTKGERLKTTFSSWTIV